MTPTMAVIRGHIPLPPTGAVIPPIGAVMDLPIVVDPTEAVIGIRIIILDTIRIPDIQRLRCQPSIIAGAIIVVTGTVRTIGGHFLRKSIASSQSPTTKFPPPEGVGKVRAEAVALIEGVEKEKAAEVRVKGIAKEKAIPGNDRNPLLEFLD